MLVRVKRDRSDEPLEELQLQFGLDGSLKRQKLLTQSEALVNRFNQVVAMDS
jgi:hypothetical protein